VLSWARAILAVDPNAQFGADAIRSIHNQEYPGITVHENVGDAPTHGYMVSLPDYEQVQSYSRLTPRDIRDYITKHQDVLEQPGNFYGGWEEDDPQGRPRWYHDVSRNIEDPWEAAEAAQGGHQKAVYDLNTNEVRNTPEFLHDQIAKGGSHG